MEIKPNICILFLLVSKQWGYGGKDNWINFPIAFTSFARVVCGCKSAHWAKVGNLSNTGFNFFTSDSTGYGYYIAVGV